MRHSVKGTKFGRKKGDRRQFIKSLMTSLIVNGAIQTTPARAKEIRPRVEKLVTLAKRQDLPALRLIMSRVPEKPAFKLYHEIAPKYADRNGGYLRIIKTAKFRIKDGADLVKIQFV